MSAPDRSAAATFRAPALHLEREELPNGLGVLLQRAPPGSVTFAATWVGEGGSARDPEGREGVATALSRLLTAGTRQRGKREFARELDALASTLSARASWERLEVEIGGPQAAEERVLALLFEALTQPLLDPRELSRVRREMREALLREESQPDEKADRVFLEQLLPSGHPYRRNPLGSRASLERLDREAVATFHRRHLSPRGTQLVLTTHTPFPQALRLLRRLFGALEGPAPAPPPLARASSVRGGARPLYVPVSGTSQAEVVIGGSAPPRDHPDYPALSLTNEILGGRPVLSRLFQVVREREGLAYGAGSELESLAWGGLWTADAGTDPAHVATVHRLLLQEVRSLCEKGPSPAELERIRESYLGSLPLLLETSPQAHSLAAEVAYFDLPLDHFARWPETLRALRPRDLRDAAAEHLWDGGPPLAVAVGPPPPNRPSVGRAR